MKKIKNKAGFTLAELLIVIAIISVLVAVAIPVFTAQLEKARVAVDQTNARAASSLAYSEYMLNHTTDGEVVYTFGTDTNDNLFILTHSAKEGDAFEDNPPEAGGTELAAKSTALKSTQLSVTVKDGKVTENTWLSALKG